MVSRCFVESDMFFCSFLDNVRATDLNLEQLLQFLRYASNIKRHHGVEISFESISDWFGFDDQHTVVSWKEFNITKQN